ncbi:hypothetical protein LguiB_027645 [Lonicera macranthoides]
MDSEFNTDTGAMDHNSKLLNEIDKMLNELEPPLSPQCCIYRIPEKLRNVNAAAYTPHMVSIGPFHHNKKKFKFTDQVKKRYMKKLVQSSGDSTLRNYIDFVRKWEARIRDCYSEHIEMDSDEFVKMILVDSCFIIQLLDSYSKEWSDIHDRSLYLAPWVFGNIALDLILLENQVPFFVLEGLFSLATVACSNKCSLLDLALQFFKEFNKHNKELDIQSTNHLTDLVLTLHRPPRRQWSKPGKEIFRSVFSSTELNEAGVVFKALSSESLFDISFTNEVLQIPSFLLDDNTETYIRNLMALEICHYPDNSCITDYIVFMDCLINTASDVDLLVQKKIIVNCLGDNVAAANLFNNLCTNVPIDDANFYFSQVCQDLNTFYEIPYHRLKAALKRDYFYTPWITASTIAAITLLVLTLIQTVWSIISTVVGD